MTNQQVKQEPLLYIQQPDLNKPKIKMQTIYMTKRPRVSQFQDQDKKEMEPTKSEKKEFLVNTNDEVLDMILLSENRETDVEKSEITIKTIQEKTTDAIQAVIEEYDSRYIETVQQISSGYSINKLKNFKEMNLVERINYLIDFPKEIPPVTCLFLTKDQLIRGYVVENNAEVIKIKQLNQSVITLKVKDIIEIKMLGY